MGLILFILGIACGVILSAGVKIVYYDDEQIEKLLKGEKK